MEDWMCIFVSIFFHSLQNHRNSGYELILSENIQVRSLSELASRIHGTTTSRLGNAFYAEPLRGGCSQCACVVAQVLYSPNMATRVADALCSVTLVHLYYRQQVL